MRPDTDIYLNGFLAHIQIFEAGCGLKRVDGLVCHLVLHILNVRFSDSNVLLVCDKIAESIHEH